LEELELLLAKERWKQQVLKAEPASQQEMVMLQQVLEEPAEDGDAATTRGRLYTNKVSFGGKTGPAGA
jgi:hypothetical protein